MRTILFCIVIYLTTPFFPPNSYRQPEDKQQQAISYIREARRIHEHWVSTLAACAKNECAELIMFAGTLEHHREWVRRYNIVLEVLEKGEQ